MAKLIPIFFIVFYLVLIGALLFGYHPPFIVIWGSFATNVIFFWGLTIND